MRGSCSRQLLAAVQDTVGKIRDAVRLSAYGARRRDRFRIVMLTAAMPAIRRSGRGHRMIINVRVGGEVVPWIVDNFADISVLEEVFGREVYHLGDLPAPATILDLGGHVGASVLFFARRYPDATIIAVEADPVNFAKLSRNVGWLPRVHLVQAAAARHSGRITLFSSGSVDSWKSSTRYATEWQRPVEVDAVGLDALLAGQDLEAPIIVKIDIEGAEYEVLDGFKGLSSVAGLVGEVHPGLMGVPVADFRRLLREFELDLPERVDHDTTFRARRRPDPAQAPA